MQHSSVGRAVQQLKADPASAPGPIYRSFAGVLALEPSLRTGPNPVLERHELAGAVSRLRTAAKSSSPRTQKEETVAYTLKGEEEQKAAKFAAERALDRRRHDVVVNIYSLVPSHRTLLTAARRDKREVVIPPAPQQLAAIAAAKASAEAGWTRAATVRPVSAPGHEDILDGRGSRGLLHGRPASSAGRHTSGKGATYATHSTSRGPSPPLGPPTRAPSPTRARRSPPPPTAPASCAIASVSPAAAAPCENTSNHAAAPSGHTRLHAGSPSGHQSFRAASPTGQREDFFRGSSGGGRSATFGGGRSPTFGGGRSPPCERSISPSLGPMHRFVALPPAMPAHLTAGSAMAHVHDLGLAPPYPPPPRTAPSSSGTRVRPGSGRLAAIAVSWQPGAAMAAPVAMPPPAAMSASFSSSSSSHFGMGANAGNSHAGNSHAGAGGGRMGVRSRSTYVEGQDGLTAAAASTGAGAGSREQQGGAGSREQGAGGMPPHADMRPRAQAGGETSIESAAAAKADGSGGGGGEHLPDVEDVPLSAFSVGGSVEAVNPSAESREERRRFQMKCKCRRILREAVSHLLPAPCSLLPPPVYCVKRWVICSLLPAPCSLAVYCVKR